MSPGSSACRDSTVAGSEAVSRRTIKQKWYEDAGRRPITKWRFVRLGDLFCLPWAPGIHRRPRPVPRISTPGPRPSRGRKRRPRPAKGQETSPRSFRHRPGLNFFKWTSRAIWVTACVAVPLLYRPKAEKPAGQGEACREKCVKIVDTLYSHQRVSMPYDLGIIGY